MVQANGDPAWHEEVESWNIGAQWLPTAGTISLNTDSNWYFGESIEGIQLNQFDFETVFLHELLHILAVNPNIKRWIRLLSIYDDDHIYYVGEHAMEVYGEAVPIYEISFDHLNPDLLYQGKYSIINPFLSLGERFGYTALELAILQDFGYQIIPEPALTCLVTLILLIGALELSNFNTTSSRRTPPRN